MPGRDRLQWLGALTLSALLVAGVAPGERALGALLHGWAYQVAPSSASQQRRVSSAPAR